MKIETIIAAVLAATTVSLAGCAADAETPEPATGSAQQASVPDQQRAIDALTGDQVAMQKDRSRAALVGDQVAIGGRAGVVIANDETNRMYDFDQTPRVSDRGDLETGIKDLINASLVPFGGEADRDLAAETESNAGVGGAKP
jgi:hypothetical protein